MSLSKDPDLKKAVLLLPQKEKDKLLIRLINKDKLLIKQLHFQLLEDEQDLEERTESLRRQFLQHMEQAVGYINNQLHTRNIKRLHTELRAYSGFINEYAYITKNVFNEAQLRLLLINKSFELFPDLFRYDPQGRNQKLLKYQAGRIKLLQAKFEKLHPDLQFDLAEGMEAMENHIGNSALSLTKD
ncbi:hypothetical protein [Olivibacter sitiensis]|uniref:hypothetical protein n=1 Tax=Olivibacter sitiensis TaxID=376470 RepID=UPI0003F97E42|nr:hypothetical protein [Olivibacter sitiensis]